MEVASMRSHMRPNVFLDSSRVRCNLPERLHAQNGHVHLNQAVCRASAAVSCEGRAQRRESAMRVPGVLSRGSFFSDIRGSGSQCSSLLGARLPGTLVGSQNSRRGRGVVTMVIPFQQGDATQQPPPDLPSYLFKNRIVFVGMSLVPAVTELLMAELLFLQYEDTNKPIYMYINSTGVTKDGEKLGYETEAFAIYDTMRYVKPAIFTLAVGNAWGEAAMLLAAGSKGNRAALPSATIMIKQPIAMFRGQATDLDIARNEVRNVKNELVELYARHTGHSKEKIENDIQRPMYMSPDGAVKYGIIDKVLNQEKGKQRTVVDSLKRSGVL
eukprot:TRINITY_DN23081_c0_g1_i1.p1 TRINITY_DN23081_c0_g1~~TRINITY_DN23081_c0_g1_i1.p1  ORF type:complete len:327 (+),score=66.47 TRINITY_DN23081_c0_g1_i1:41-1021(+)